MGKNLGFKDHTFSFLLIWVRQGVENQGRRLTLLHFCPRYFGTFLQLVQHESHVFDVAFCYGTRCWALRSIALILKICISSWRKILRSIWKDLKTSKDWQNAQLRLSRKCVGHIVIVIWFKATSFWQSLIINQYWQYCSSLTQRSRKMGGGRLSVGAYSNDQEMLIFQDSDPRMSCMLCGRKVFS